MRNNFLLTLSYCEHIYPGLPKDFTWNTTFQALWIEKPFTVLFTDRNLIGTMTKGGGGKYIQMVMIGVSVVNVPPEWTNHIIKYIN